MAENDTAGKTLSSKQRAAIAALLSCGTVRAAAASAGIAERTIYRWMGEPVFVAELRAAEQTTIGEAARQLVGLATDALEEVRKILSDQAASPTLKLRAAQIVLENLLKLRELVSLEERISKLEEMQK